MWPLVIGAAIGAAQYDAQQKQAQRDRRLQSTTAALSPWTGMRPGATKDADLAGTLGGGIMTGMQADQQMDAQKAQENFQNQYLENQQKYNTIQQQQGSGQGGAPSMMSGTMGPHQDPNAYNQQQVDPVWQMMLAKR